MRLYGKDFHRNGVPLQETADQAPTDNWVRLGVWVGEPHRESEPEVSRSGVLSSFRKTQEIARLRKLTVDRVGWFLRYPSKPYWVVLLYPNVKRLLRNDEVVAWVPGLPQQEMIEVTWPLQKVSPSP